MASEVIKLNLIPKGEMPVFHASQFDTGRLITCELYRGEDAYSVPEGYTVELHCRKVDNKIVTMASTLINDNVVTFTSTEQLTACNGKNLCEVAILDEGYRIGTLNFYLEVEIDPLKGGINSTSEIHNLETQVEEITTEIVGENYYNKTEVDTLLSDKADADTVYTKTETDTKLALKANAADVYTKSETDTKLALKANAADVYTKSETDTKLALKANAADVYTKSETDTKLALKANAADVYTKTEVDNIILDIMPVGTASGPIATFNTELAAPLVNVSCDIFATGGGGTPASPVPIVGKSQANINANGTTVTIAFGQTVYGGVLDVTRGKLHVTHYGVEYDGTEDGWSWYGDYQQASIALPYPAKYDIDNITYKCNRLTPVLNQSRPQNIGNYASLISRGANGAFSTPETSLANFKTWLGSNHIQFVYELATPFDIDLTPVQIRALVGENNVFGDTNGSTTVQFKDSIQHYIDKHIGG